MERHFKFAVENIAKYGDTDIFPFPIENHVFFDRPDDVVKILLLMHGNLTKAIEDSPPMVEGMLSPVGYTGFRWATQIDPIWNAYFLGLVISVGQDIENARIPSEKKNVFSYRFQPDQENKTIFNKSIGWAEFQRESVEKARKSKYVLVCDISDFYPSVYHHRLDNALSKATSNKSNSGQIMKLLMNFSGNVSYGLPVGGPASRLLSELLLNRVDRLLITNGIDFCRFADDYHIFADSAEDAYNSLLFLSVKLQANEGLLLQKTKTKVISSDEFLATSEFASENEPESLEQTNNRMFLRLRLHYDPYSATADEDYELLKSEITKFDIVGMLGRELKKSRIHQSLTKKLISAIKLLNKHQRDSAIVSMMDNLPILFPVFPSILHLVKGTIDDISDETRETVFGRLRELLQNNSYILSVPTHLAYTVRILANDTSVESDEILSKIYEKSNSNSIRRDVILVMAKRNADYWISDVRRNFRTITEWERTALLVSSFMLGDEGEHWRRSIKSLISPMQKLVLEWMDARINSGNNEVAI